MSLGWASALSDRRARASRIRIDLLYAEFMQRGYHGFRRDCGHINGANNFDGFASRRPNGGIGRAEESDGWYPYRGGEMGDSAVVADIRSGAGEEFGQVEEVWDKGCSFHVLFGAAKFNKVSAGQAEACHTRIGPAFILARGEGVKNDAVVLVYGTYFDLRDCA